MSLAKLQDLSGQVALVTGGSRGLGLQIAEVLGELGARVAITARKRHELDEAGARLKSLGVEALPLVCDMSDFASIPPMVGEVIDRSAPSTFSSTTPAHRGARRRSSTRLAAGAR